jgi:hypothetical protein
VRDVVLKVRLEHPHEASAATAIIHDHRPILYISVITFRKPPHRETIEYSSEPDEASTG